MELIAERHARELFSDDGSTIDDQVAELLAGPLGRRPRSRARRGLMAARLTERPGSSAYFAGGVVAYSNEAKAELLGVDPGLIERTARCRWRWPRRWPTARWRASRPTRPWRSRAWRARTAGPRRSRWARVLGVKLADGRKIVRDVRLPGDRADVRDRSTTVAMHLLRRLLRGEDFEL